MPSAETEMGTLGRGYRRNHWVDDRDPGYNVAPRDGAENGQGMEGINEEAPWRHAVFLNRGRYQTGDECRICDKIS